MKMSRRNRGRNNRGIVAPVRVGLGNRRVRRRLGGVTRAPMELRAMGSTMTNGASDPDPIMSTIKVHHRVELSRTSSSTAGTVTNLTVSDVLTSIPGIAGWTEFRVLKVSVWGNDVANVIVNMDGPQSDSGYFTDWGSPGAKRAGLHILPTFEQRQFWIPASSSAIPIFGYASSTASVPMVIHLSLELRSSPPSTIALMRVEERLESLAL